MLANQIYLDKLKSLLRLYPRLLWLSEGESKIEAVRLPWYRIWNWERESDGAETDRLNGQVEADPNHEGMTQLRDLIFEQDNLISIKLDTKAKSEKTLYILTRFGIWWYVGIRINKIIET